MARTPTRTRIESFWKHFREEEHRQMARNFAKSMIMLGVALVAALYSNSSARDGRIISSAIGAMIALSIAVWVGFRFVPRLAAGVDWDWLPFFTEYRLTSEGWIYIAAITVVISAAINTNNNLLYMVLSALLAVLLLSGFLSGLNFRFLRVTARLPDYCFARQPFQVAISVRNGKRLFATFSLKVEPVKEGRLQFPSFYIPLIRTRGQDTRMVEAELPERGQQHLKEIYVQSRYPFGFLSKGRPLPVEANCIVFPEIMPSDHMDVTLFDILGMSARFRRGQGVDLYLIRDYVTSDSARHLDWKASAKTSTLKTREFAAEDSRQVLLAFDRYGKPGDEDRSESLVSYAASIALHLIRDDVELSLISDDWTSASGHSENLLQSILSYLALVEMSDSAVGPGADANGTVVLSLRQGGIANTAWQDISTSHSTL